MSAIDQPPTSDRLDDLIAGVLRNYGPTCFRNVRTDLPRRPMTELAMRWLRKYGATVGGAWPRPRPGRRRRTAT